MRMFERLISAATPNYRVVCEAALPAPIHDLVAVIRYLRCYSGELSINANRIAAWGDSAGAHLSTTAALAGSDPESDT